MFDVKDIVARVDRVVAAGGDDPYLVGYDVNEIQAFVTASSRPIVMRGASETIATFDRQEEDESIFAGGGQGITIRCGAAAAEQKRAELEQRFRQMTSGDALATAAVRLDRKSPQHSRRWLRQRLALGKDAAPKPEIALPETKKDQCASCSARKATRTHTRYERPERICDRCDKVIRLGWSEEGMAQSLGELSPTGRIAAVSADGNDFGALFDELETLQSLAVVSVAVRRIFQAARDRATVALPARKLPNGRSTPPAVGVAVGGDDVRTFVAEERALHYVRNLVDGLRLHATTISRELRGAPGVPAKTCESLANLGVGIGLVSSDSHFPAYRLMEYAHDLERSAKRLCTAKVRFALDFLVLRSGDELIQGIAKRAGESDDIRPIDLTAEGDPLAWKQARALSRVPTAQQAMFAEAARAERRSAGEQTSLAETASLLRYQVARSGEWQAYYSTCGADWTKPAQVEQHRPRQAIFDLARLLGGNHGSL